jgi:S1-C subfamily serine protease
MLHVILCWLAVASAAFALPIDAPAPLTAHERTWEATVKRVSDSVVSLKVTAVRDFDTEDAGASLGTGFVVDAERGLILTNHHMVHEGPVIAEAVFSNHQEVALEPIYRDPIHDFGFYRYDPKAVDMTVTALPLVPTAARVGMEIRVIGNDAGEKLSILDGTLARLDRNAPDYGGDTYNDFDTFYYEAASNTSGGSSGSPVIDIDGQVVALNAGGSNDAAASFYLPLDRVVEALAFVQRGEAVPRGTIGVVFTHTAFDELDRLGLRPETEDQVRATFPDGSGMLVVDETIPGLPAADELQSGDVLVKVDGELVSTFTPLEDRLDDVVGGPVTLEIERGGQPKTIALASVADLHAVSPASYLEIGRSVLHTTSLTQARNNTVAAAGVYVAVPGYWLGIAGIPEGAILTGLDGVAVPTLDAFQAELEAKAQGQRVRVRYHLITDPRREQVAVASVDRLWFPMQRCTRDDSTGMWPCVASQPPPRAAAPAPQTAAIDVEGDKLARKLGLSFVLVDFDVPHPTSGIKDVNYVGCGVVVDAAKGLVLVDRDTVPVALGDMTLTFGGAVRVPGKLVYLHPEHNIAFVQYDPKLLGDTPVQAVTLADRAVHPGDRLWQVGLDGDQKVVSLETNVQTVDALSMGIASTPRFRDVNVEGIELHDAVPTLGGVLATKDGTVVAQWASFVDQASGNRGFFGLPAMYILPALSRLKAGEPVEYRSLGAELDPIALSDARERGLSEARARELQAHDPHGRTMLIVTRRTAATPAFDRLQDGDLILAIDGAPVTRLRELEAFTAVDHVDITVLRDNDEVEVPLDTTPLDGDGVDRVVAWAGLVVHAPHLEVASQQGIPPDGVYAAWMWYGSPASTYQFRPTRRIVAINDVPTPDLDAFLAAVKGETQGQAVRVKMLTLDGRVQVATMKLDPHYWPTTLFELVDGEWRGTRVE